MSTFIAVANVDFDWLRERRCKLDLETLAAGLHILKKEKREEIMKKKTLDERRKARTVFPSWILLVDKVKVTTVNSFAAIGAEKVLEAGRLTIL